MGLSKSDKRLFLLCSVCSCVFLDSRHLLGPSEERARYEQHRNAPTPEYESFLNRLVDPLGAMAPAGTKEGLDYGCGPVPVLSALLEKKGVKMAHYDPFFFPEPELLDKQYSVIACSEAAEHFHRPRQEFDRLNRLMKPGSVLGVMTQMRAQWDGFFDWYYPRDPTHVTFYSPRTMRWIASQYGWVPTFLPHSVVIFRKEPSSASGEAT
jgi:hypothetical protein